MNMLQKETTYLPLTTLQKWFLDRWVWVNPDRWNIAFLLEAAQPLDPEALYRTVRYLFTYHDGLRIRFTRIHEQWRASISELGEELPLTLMNISTLSAAEQQNAISSTAEALQESLSIVEGRLVHLVYFDLGENNASYILWVSHHLIADGFSCQIILQDFERIYQAYKNKQPVRSPLKTASLKEWTERLEKYVDSPTMRQEFENYWLRLPWDQLIPFPVDYPENRGKDTNGSVESLAIGLEDRETEALFAQIRAFHTDIICVLLTGLVEASKQWPELHMFYVDVPDHGRAVLNDLNLLRTVGQIAIGRRYLLHLDRSLDICEALHFVEKQMSDTPNNGIGYDLLAYFSQDPEISAKMQTLPLHDVLLNYLGRQGGGTKTHPSLFRPTHIPIGATEDPRERRESTLRFTASVIDNELWIMCQYSKVLHMQSSIEQMLQKYEQALKAFIAL